MKQMSIFDFVAEPPSVAAPPPAPPSPPVKKPVRIQRKRPKEEA